MATILEYRRPLSAAELQDQNERFTKAEVQGGAEIIVLSAERKKRDRSFALAVRGEDATALTVIPDDT